jgi:hypothetical protein
MPSRPDDRYRELGRKLFAAVLSERLRLRSIDYTLKNYVPDELDPSWGELGWKLLGEMTEAASRRLQQAEQQGRRRQQIHVAVDNTDLPF